MGASQARKAARKRKFGQLDDAVAKEESSVKEEVHEDNDQKPPPQSVETVDAKDDPTRRKDRYILFIGIPS